jgi:hypothetical protein
MSESKRVNEAYFKWYRDNEDKFMLNGVHDMNLYRERFDDPDYIKVYNDLKDVVRSNRAALTDKDD